MATRINAVTISAASAMPALAPMEREPSGVEAKALRVVELEGEGVVLAFAGVEVVERFWREGVGGDMVVAVWCGLGV